MPHAQVPSVPKTVTDLRESGIQTIALTPNANAQKLTSAISSLSRPLAFIICSEGYGLSDDSLSVADCIARIPMQNNVDSLNVATSLAIALYAANTES